MPQTHKAVAQQIREGFIVDESEDEEEGDVEGRERERRRKRKRRRAEREEEAQLDEEDLDLIGESIPDYKAPNQVSSKRCIRA